MTETGATIIMNSKIYNRKMSRLSSKMQAVKKLLNQISGEYESLRAESPELWQEYCEVNELDVSHTATDAADNKSSKKVQKVIDSSEWDW